MSTDMQAPPKVDNAPDKQPRRRSKDTEKAHRRSSNFQNKKHKHDHKFRKRSQSFISANGKFFPPYKMRKKDFIIPPTKFLLGGNITDPLNLNSLQDEEINRAMNAVTPKSSPLPTPRHRRGEIEVIIPPDITDPLNLIAGDDDATYEAMLSSPIKRTQKKPKKNKKRRSHRSASGPGSGKEDSIEGAKLDETAPDTTKEENNEKTEENKKDIQSGTEISTVTKEPSQGPAQKRQKGEGQNKTNGNNNRSSLRKMELKERKADLDKIVSPVIPQPGAWNDRHRFRPPPQRTPQLNKGQEMPKFKESNARFQYGNYNRYYGYRNPKNCTDGRLKVLEKRKDLFRNKDVLDIGCNTGHLTLAIARDFGPTKVVGLDIDRALIQVARTNIRHYVNCGKKDKFFPVSMPIVYGPIDVPGVSEDKAFPNNISFVQGNYVLESDVQLSMEQPQFDVILCLSITKWIQLNWGDAGLKRAFKRMYAQLRPGGVLILEAQSWSSYKKKKQLTPEIWNNYHSIELFPHQFSQYLLSEVGFSKCEVIGSPLHHTRGFQRPIKLFIKEDPSFDTPVYSADTSAYGSATPKYYRDMPGRFQHFASNMDRFSYRLTDSVHFPTDEFSGDSSFPYGTPSSYNSPESGFSESLHNLRRCYPPRIEPMVLEEAGCSQNQRECPNDAANTSEESRPTSAVKDELLGDEDNTALYVDSNSQEIESKVESDVQETGMIEIDTNVKVEVDADVQDNAVFNVKVEVDDNVKMEVDADVQDNAVFTKPDNAEKQGELNEDVAGKTTNIDVSDHKTDLINHRGEEVGSSTFKQLDMCMPIEESPSKDKTYDEKNDEYPIRPELCKSKETKIQESDRVTEDISEIEELHKQSKEESTNDETCAKGT